MLRFLTAGESHGPSLSVIVEGLPSGLAIGVDEIADELARRRLGYGRGPRMRFERDELRIIGGVRHGRTLGSPVAVEILNSEWPKWEQEMSAAPGTPAQKQTKPRPGHADLAGMQKYGFDDARDVLERASARETAARVVAGTLAKALLTSIGIAIVSHVIRIGEAATTSERRPMPGDLDAVDENEVRCFDPASAEAMIVAIKAAAKVGDSLGGYLVLAAGAQLGDAVAGVVAGSCTFAMRGLAGAVARMSLVPGMLIRRVPCGRCSTAYANRTSRARSKRAGSRRRCATSRCGR